MIDRITTVPRPRTDLVLVGVRRGKETWLRLGEDSGLLFFDTTVVAAVSGGYVYFPEPRSAAEQRAVNSTRPEAPHVRVSGREFDFIVGSVLSTTGLPLTRLEEVSNA